jgi:fructose-1,6-bisphosphatase
LGTWYSRGTRITAVVGEYAYFDGRASAAQNYEERTGIARWDGSRYVAVAGPASSPFGGGALRYVSAITLPDGRLRLYYESATEYGSHELRTELRAQP